MSLLDLANPYHAYVFGTSFWYFLRGIVRVIDPATVVDWFRPPSQLAEPNDLELYTVRTDAFCLLSLSALLLILADAVPLPGNLVGSSLTAFPPRTNTKTTSTTLRPETAPYARGIIVITILHHIATGIGSWGHYRLVSHYTFAMAIGVWGNVGLTLLGIVALYSLKLDGSTGDGWAGSVGEVATEESKDAINIGGHSLRKRA